MLFDGAARAGMEACWESLTKSTQDLVQLACFTGEESDDFLIVAGEDSSVEHVASRIRHGLKGEGSTKNEDIIAQKSRRAKMAEERWD